MHSRKEEDPRMYTLFGYLLPFTCFLLFGILEEEKHNDWVGEEKRKAGKAR